MYEHSPFLSLGFVIFCDFRHRFIIKPKRMTKITMINADPNLMALPTSAMMIEQIILSETNRK